MKYQLTTGFRDNLNKQTQDYDGENLNPPFYVYVVSKMDNF